MQDTRDVRGTCGSTTFLMQKYVDYAPNTCHQSTRLATNAAVPMIPPARSASISPALPIGRGLNTTQDCNSVSVKLFISGTCIVEAEHGDGTLLMLKPKSDLAE